MAEGVNNSWAFVYETIVIVEHLLMLCVPCQLFCLWNVFGLKAVP